QVNSVSTACTGCGASTSSSQNPSLSLTTEDNLGDVCVSFFAEASITTSSSASSGNLRANKTVGNVPNSEYIGTVDNFSQNIGSCATGLTTTSTVDQWAT